MAKNKKPNHVEMYLNAVFSYKVPFTREYSSNFSINGNRHYMIEAKGIFQCSFLQEVG